jgi:hypothetical protein
MTLAEESFHARDPVARLALDALRLSPVGLAATCFLLELVVGAMQAGYGLFVVRDPRLGPFISWGHASGFAANLIFSLVVTPLIWAFYAWMAKTPGRLVASLRGRGLFPSMTDADFEAEAKGARRRFNAAGWPIAAATVSLAVAFLYISLTPRNAQPYVYMRLPLWFILWYMLGMIAAREWCLITTLSGLFARWKLDLHPLHPDQCGGLGPLNHYATNFTLLIATCGLGLVLNVYMLAGEKRVLDILLHGAIGVYLVLGPAFFFATLGTAHRAMKTAKDELLGAIAARFEVDYQAARSELSKSDPKLAEGIERISQLKTLYRETDAFPVWPLDIRSLTKFGGALLAPLAMDVMKHVALAALGVS